MTKKFLFHYPPHSLFLFILFILFTFLYNPQSLAKDDLKFDHQRGHSVLYIAVKQRFYILGGYLKKNCEYYDINEDTCIEIAPVNDKMKCYASGCLCNDKFIYLIGGSKSQENFLEELDIDGNNEWKVIDIKNQLVWEPKESSFTY